MKFALAAAATAAITSIALPALAAPRERVEQPRFEVVAEHGEFEVREYAPRIVAEVTVDANDAKKASNAGFRVLAGFIFGNNRARNEIAMTSPVGIQDTRGASQEIAMTSPVGREREAGGWVISFTMPSRWTMETLPKPNDARVRIREIPPQRYAVRAFSGAPSDRVVEQREAELRKWAKEAGYAVDPSPAVYNRYDPPWVPWFARRNELWVGVEAPAAAAAAD